MFAGWALITMVAIFCASRVTTIVVALRVVESKHKADVPCRAGGASAGGDGGVD
jgi:hypothetical protein